MKPPAVSPSGTPSALISPPTCTACTRPSSPPDAGRAGRAGGGGQVGARLGYARPLGSGQACLALGARAGLSSGGLGYRRRGPRFQAAPSGVAPRDRARGERPLPRASDVLAMRSPRGGSVAARRGVGSTCPTPEVPGRRVAGRRAGRVGGRIAGRSRPSCHTEDRPRGRVAIMRRSTLTGDYGCPAAEASVPWRPARKWTARPRPLLARPASLGTVFEHPRDASALSAAGRGPATCRRAPCSLSDDLVQIAPVPLSSYRRLKPRGSRGGLAPAPKHPYG